MRGQSPGGGIRQDLFQAAVGDGNAGCLRDGLGPNDWLFQTEHGRRGFLNADNYRNRILKPAAIRAGIGLIETGKKDATGRPIGKTDVDFRALRRTCGTLFGDRAKDPKSTQAQLRHADAAITLKALSKGYSRHREGGGNCLRE